MYSSPQRQSDPVERECEEPEAAGWAAQSYPSPRREDQASIAIRILEPFWPGRSVANPDPGSGIRDWGLFDPWIRDPE
jgi:hypothetical protein